MVRTRFAPSPTGHLHIGGARTALFCWLYARRFGGQFLLRIEDTDRERSKDEYTQGILAGLQWLGLAWDEPPIYQSARLDRYRQVIDLLMEKGLAYRCYCTKEELDALREAQMQRGEKPRYDGRYRDHHGPPRAGVEPVIRFKNPQDGEVTFHDRIRGPITVANSELDDLVIARADGTPTYNFCVVVDDWDMQITHVIRGEDHVSNTPRQINIFRALGAEPPQYAHLPMILGPDGKKLSKRDGAASALDYRQQGYLPAALVNYLVRLGWSHGDQEIFSREALVALFDIDHISLSAGALNPSKLLWLNQHYLKTLPVAELRDEVAWHAAALGIDWAAIDQVDAVIDALRERSKTTAELATQMRLFSGDAVTFDDKAVAKHLTAAALPVLTGLATVFAMLSPWETVTLHEAIHEFAAAHDLKMGEVGMPLRVALSGSSTSPANEIMLALLGKSRSLQRLETAIGQIKKGVDG